MKKIAMFALIVTALVTASTAFARPYGCYRGYYGYPGYYRGYGYYYYGGAPIVDGVAALIGAGLNLAADIVTFPLRGGVVCPAPAVCPAAPVVYAPAPPAPVVYAPAPPAPAPVVYTTPPAPVVYAPALPGSAVYVPNRYVVR